MATIGKFTKKGDDYEGHIETRTWHTPATIKPVTKTSEKGPDFRIFAGRHEFGAGWKKTSEAGMSYLSITLDDPSFAATLNCRLHESGVGSADGFELIWTRS